jgi:S-adenosylmethionine synthetase
MSHFLFTSESVGIGHPDKVCDQIADSILDACLKQDLDSRVACEIVAAPGLVLVTGEITTKAQINYRNIVKNTIKLTGYDDPSLGFDYQSCGILISLNEQSPDISRGIDPQKNLFHLQGAGDQGIMFGFACDETPELMPLPIMLAHRLVFELYVRRTKKNIPWLRPDAKSQVTVEYDETYHPVRVDAIVLSTQHSEDISHEQICVEMEKLIKETMPANLIDRKTKFYINPTGRFVIGGPAGDCGLTGRKPMVDTYGGMAHHGGGSFSGKDPTKIDRAAAYAARYVAKNIVAAHLARRCEVQFSYAIGVPYPISIKVDTFGTGIIGEDKLTELIPKVFDLSPLGIINMLKLKRPIYFKTAFGGHFGRELPEFTWESTDKVPLLKSLA